MLKTVSALNSLLTTILSLVIVAALGVGGWFAYHAYYRDKWALEETQKALHEKQEELGVLSGQLASSRQQVESLASDLEAKEREIESLNKDLEAKRREIERLSTAIRLLKVDHRVAQVDVLWQGGTAEKGDLATRISFVELDESGRPLEKPRVFTIDGDVVHVAALVVKFADEHVEMGDPMRSTSLCLFKRIYGDKQQPEKGFALDAVGSRPAAYGSGGQMSQLEREIWSKFWDYANDAEQARKAGVRAAHGEAVFQKMRPGKRYKVLLRASGGLTIIPEDRPAEQTGQTF